MGLGPPFLGSSPENPGNVGEIVRNMIRQDSGYFPLFSAEGGEVSFYKAVQVY